MKGYTFTTMDGLRGVAAIMVVLFHAPATRPLVESAYLAVDLFFALSGFVLAHSSLAKLTSMRASVPFMVKRLIRLYPLYLLGLGLGVAAAAFTTILEGNFWPTGIIVATGLNGVFLPVPLQYSLNGWSAYPLNGPSWSLAFEMLVNLALGLFAFAYTARRLGVLLVLSAGGLIAASLIHGGVDGGPTLATFYIGLARVTFSFFLGIAIYRMWASGRFTTQVPWWLSTGGLVAILCLPLPEAYRPVGDLVIVLLAFPLLLATATGSRPLPLLQYLGRVSYAVYILHMPIFYMLRTASTHYLGVEFVSFGIGGSLVLLALVLAVSTVLDPVDAAIRRVLTRGIARSPWRATLTEAPAPAAL